MLSTSLIIIASLVTAWGSEHEEIFHQWTCPGENIILECPPGQVIDLLALDHGEKATDDCDAESEFADISSHDCFKWKMLGWSKLICDKWESCRLPKPHPFMFACNDSENFFVRSTYLCKDQNPDVRSIEVCDGKLATLQCEEGLIRIVKANYGRLEQQECNENREPSTKTFCASYSAGGLLEQHCDGKSECNILVGTHNLGEAKHCDDLPKYLKVDYVCE